MPIPTSIDDLNPVAANNFPAGSNAPSVLDDVQREHASYIAQLRDSLADLTSAVFAAGIQNFRLTLTAGVPVTTSDTTAATTIYCAPYIGKGIALYDGSQWNIRQSAQFSISLGTLTSGKPYDVFCYDNAGVPTLEILAWASDTARATALAYQDGVLCKSGALTRRYLGSFYTTSTTTTEDSVSKRYLFNYYHRKPKPLQRNESTAFWTYSTATWRQANGSTANQVNFFVGVVEDEVEATVTASGICDNTFRGGVAVGLNSITTPTGQYASTKVTNSSAIPEMMWTPSFRGYPTLGLNYFAWLEWAEAGGTNTWYGVFSAATQQAQSGISARVMA